MKVSEITVNHLADYLVLDNLSPSETELLETLLLASKNYIKSYTGLTDDEIDNHEDLVIVVYILTQDMWDNRTLYVDNKSLNKVVETILGMHSVNLL